MTTDMNDTTPHDGRSDATWPANDPQSSATGAPKVPQGGPPAPAVVGLLNHAVRGAHDTIDRLAAGAQPVAQHLSQGVAAAEVALHDKADRLRLTTDEWVEGARNAVRTNPLLAVMGAVALGAALVILTRSNATHREPA